MPKPVALGCLNAWRIQNVDRFFPRWGLLKSGMCGLSGMLKLFLARSNLRVLFLQDPHFFGNTDPLKTSSVSLFPLACSLTNEYMWECGTFQDHHLRALRDSGWAQSACHESHGLPHCMLWRGLLPYQICMLWVCDDLSWDEKGLCSGLCQVDLAMDSKAWLQDWLNGASASDGSVEDCELLLSNFLWEPCGEGCQKCHCVRFFRFSESQNFSCWGDHLDMQCKEEQQELWASARPNARCSLCCPACLG